MKEELKNETKNEREVERELKDVIITKKEGGKEGALRELLKMRYGKEWRKANGRV
jgi:hypothetical protein